MTPWRDTHLPDDGRTAAELVRELGTMTNRLLVEAHAPGCPVGARCTCHLPRFLRKLAYAAGMLGGMWLESEAAHGPDSARSQAVEDALAALVTAFDLPAPPPVPHEPKGFTLR